MALLLDIEENLPEQIIYDISSGFKIPVHRVGNFYNTHTGPGCGKDCIWNGGGYYMDVFSCGTTYPSGKTFYCSSDCYKQVGHSTQVFLSYRWNDPGIADDFTELALGSDIEVIRDIREIGFLEAISKFMETAAASRYFIALMTKEYFYSRYCLFELTALSEGDLPVRTIPVIMNQSATADAEREYCAYWESRYLAMKVAVDELGLEYAGYLSGELQMLHKFPFVIRNVLGTIREKKIPDGIYWISNNCRYLLGAIKTTFQPTTDDATNWTFSNKRIRANRYNDEKRGKAWDAVPFYLHASTTHEAYAITRKKNTSALLKKIYYADSLVDFIPAGTHVLLLTWRFLVSDTLCMRLISLSKRKEVTLIPVFTDALLRIPGSEVPVLLYWSKRLHESLTEKNHSPDSETILLELGPLLSKLRDHLVQDIFVSLD
jgi:hypothetical protein